MGNLGRLFLNRMLLTRMHQYRVRHESPSDIASIALFTKEAFKDQLRSEHNEHLIIAKLRQNGGLAISLVAVHEAKVVGHVAFFPGYVFLWLPALVGRSPAVVQKLLRNAFRIFPWYTTEPRG